MKKSKKKATRRSARITRRPRKLPAHEVRLRRTFEQLRRRIVVLQEQLQDERIRAFQRRTLLLEHLKEQRARTKAARLNGAEAARRAVEQLRQLRRAVKKLLIVLKLRNVSEVLSSNLC